MKLFYTKVKRTKFNQRMLTLHHEHFAAVSNDILKSAYSYIFEIFLVFILYQITIWPIITLFTLGAQAATASGGNAPAYMLH